MSNILNNNPSWAFKISSFFAYNTYKRENREQSQQADQGLHLYIIFVYL